jgi:hypothetical protein
LRKGESYGLHAALFVSSKNKILIMLHLANTESPGKIRRIHFMMMTYTPRK